MHVRGVRPLMELNQTEYEKTSREKGNLKGHLLQDLLQDGGVDMFAVDLRRISSMYVYLDTLCTCKYDLTFAG